MACGLLNIITLSIIQTLPYPQPGICVSVRLGTIYLSSMVGCTAESTAVIQCTPWFHKTGHMWDIAPSMVWQQRQPEKCCTVWAKPNHMSLGRESRTQLVVIRNLCYNDHWLHSNRDSQLHVTHPGEQAFKYSRVPAGHSLCLCRGMQISTLPRGAVWWIQMRRWRLLLKINFN